jgi:hypothetical protein
VITAITQIGANSQVNIYNHITNGIKYNVFQTDDGFYQVTWCKNWYYYTLFVRNKSILPEIMDNLKENYKLIMIIVLTILKKSGKL